MARVLLCTYDNGSYIHQFPAGIAYLAAAIRNAGHDARLWLQDAEHWPAEDLTRVIDEYCFDVVGLGFIGGYWQYRRALEISEAVERSSHRNNLTYVLGGHGPAPDPAWAMGRFAADAVVVGEGERAILDVIAGARGVVTAPQQDVNEIAEPAYDLFPINYYRLCSYPRKASTEFAMPVLSGRGCPFRCAFCYRLDKGFRPRSAEGILAEVERLQRDYRVSYINFSDELLMAGERRTRELCEAFLRHPRPFRWMCNGRLNYAKAGLLSLMARAGCVFINYGCESTSDRALKAMHKSLTVAQMTSGVEATLRAGISPGLNFMFGNPLETKEDLWRTVRFLLKYDDHAQMRTIRPVTPYPGTELFEMAVSQGRIGSVAEFYERAHVNSDLASVQFTGMSNEEFHRELCAANQTLVREYHERAADSKRRQLDELYTGHNDSFRGFRQT